MVLSQIMSNSVNFVFFSQTDWSGGLTNITLTRELISEQFIFWKLLTIEWQSVGTEQSKHSMNWLNLNPKYWTNVWRRELMKKMYIKHKLIMGNNVCRPLLISHGLYFLHPRPVWRVSSPLIFVIVLFVIYTHAFTAVAWINGMMSYAQMVCWVITVREDPHISQDNRGNLTPLFLC